MKSTSIKATLVLCLVSAISMLSAAAASAAWETPQVVDVQDSRAGATGSYVGLADSANGTSTAFFEQKVGSDINYYGIRRGATDPVWGSTQMPFPLASPAANAPIAAGSDALGNTLAATVQQSPSQVFGAIWPAGSNTPDGYSLVMSPPAGSTAGLSDPEIQFDAAGYGYEVAGESSSAGSSTDQPIMLAVYKPNTGTPASVAPVVVQNPGSTTTCTNAAVTNPNEICGQEPRLAVSPDGTVVITFLETTSGRLPGTTQEQLYAVRAPAGAVAGSAGASGFTDIARISQSGDQVPTTNAPLIGSSSNVPPNFDVALDAKDTAWIVDAESQSGFNNNVYATQWPASSTKPDPPAQLSSGSPPEPPASAPRVVTEGPADVTVAWIESSQTSPPAAALYSAECCFGGNWTSPEKVADPVDNPNDPSSSYGVNTPPFWLAEDGGANAYLVWTSGGSWQDSIRQAPSSSKPKNWSAPDTMKGVSGAVPGTARVAVGLTGQPDAMVIATSNKRNALFATRFPAPAPQQSTTSSLPQQNPQAPPIQSGAPANGSKPKPNPTPNPTPCRARPTSRISHAKVLGSAKGVSVGGSAGEPTCAGASASARSRNHVAKVFVSIYRPAGKGRCRFLVRSGRLTKPLPCTRRIEFAAHGTTKWSLTLRIKVPVGAYLIRSDAVDGFHRHQTRSSGSVVRLRIRAGRAGRSRHH